MLGGVPAVPETVALKTTLALIEPEPHPLMDTLMVGGGCVVVVVVVEVVVVLVVVVPVGAGAPTETVVVVTGAVKSTCSLNWPADCP